MSTRWSQRSCERRQETDDVQLTHLEHYLASVTGLVTGPSPFTSERGRPQSSHCPSRKSRSIPNPTLFSRSLLAELDRRGTTVTYVPGIASLWSELGSTPMDETA